MFGFWALAAAGLWVQLAVADEPGQAKSSLAPLVELLGMVDDPAFQRDVLKGMHESLNGRRDVKMPEGWPAVSKKLAGSKDAEVRKKALVLSLIFGDPQALLSLRKSVMDASASAAERTAAIEALAQKQDGELVPLLHKLLADRELRGPALRGLAAYSDAATPQIILRLYSTFGDQDKRDAINTLASRVAYARELLTALELKTVPSRDLSAFTVRQLVGLNDREITEKLNVVWGSTRPTSEDKAATIARYKKLLTPAALKDADRSQGRQVYSRTCAACHALFGEGGKVGPELTGSQRGNLDYLLENLVDPNAVVGRDYRVTVLETTEGRVINGIVQAETDNTVTLQTPNGAAIIAKSDIAERNVSNVSMMPEGALDSLMSREVLNLVAYLAGAEQVGLPVEGGGRK